MKHLRKNSSGQVMMEFVLMAGMVLSVTLVLWFFLAIYTEYAWRLMMLIGWEPD